MNKTPIVTVLAGIIASALAAFGLTDFPQELTVSIAVALVGLGSYFLGKSGLFKSQS